MKKCSQVVLLMQVRCKNYGTNADLVHKYPYCDVLGMREVDPTLKCIAKECDRSVEWSCIEHISPLYTTGPKIASLVTQYGLGKPYDENVFARRIVKICIQESIVFHLYHDSGDNRLMYFYKSLQELKIILGSSDNSEINKVVLPIGIRIGLVNQR